MEEDPKTILSLFLFKLPTFSFQIHDDIYKVLIFIFKFLDCLLFMKGFLSPLERGKLEKKERIGWERQKLIPIVYIYFIYKKKIFV